MLFVLKSSGRFYAGKARNSYDAEAEVMTDNLRELVVFQLRIKAGKVEVFPDLPDGDWDVATVSIDVD